MHPLLRQFREICERDGRSFHQVALMAGVERDTVARWLGQRKTYQNPNGPSLVLFEYVLNALGYRLTIERIGEGE
jgi:transcriptional regulator with XRE-family HTH domain